MAAAGGGGECGDGAEWSGGCGDGESRAANSRGGASKVTYLTNQKPCQRTYRNIFNQHRRLRRLLRTTIVKVFCYLHRLSYYVIMLLFFFPFYFPLCCAVTGSVAGIFIECFLIHSAFGLVVHYTPF